MSSLDLSDTTGPSSTPAAAAAPGDLVLAPPEPVADIAPAQAVQAVTLADETRTALEQKAHGFVQALVSMPANSPEFEKAAGDVGSLARKEILSSTDVSNRMLDRPAAQAQANSPQARTSSTLAELRITVSELDPHRADLKGAKKALKLLPGGMRREVQRYFIKYESAQDQLDAIVRALVSGQDELRKDNAAIQQERSNMWATMGKIKEYILLLDAVKAEITQEVDNRKAAGDVEMASALEKDALFSANQRHQDLMTHLAVSVQGYLALGLVKTNNEELIKGVERARTTTLAALRTAVITAQALGMQQQILAQIQGLNQSTEDLIVKNAQALQQQGVEIHKQAASSAISAEALEKAFDSVFQAMDEVDRFRIEANRSMDTTSQRMRAQIERAAPYIDRSNRNMGGNVDAIGQ